MGLKLKRWQLQLIIDFYHTRASSITKYSTETGIDRSTISKWCKRFRLLQEANPKRLIYVEQFYPIKATRAKDTRHKDLISILPVLMSECKDRRTECYKLWQAYLIHYPNGYAYGGFRQNYIQWRRENNICEYAHKGVKAISKQDNQEFNSWRKGSSLEYWRKAIVIQGSFNKVPLKELSTKIDIGIVTIHKWIASYNELGIKGLDKKPMSTDFWLDQKTEKRDNIMKLLHETPKLHGFNRTSWRREDLAIAYKTTYNKDISVTNIGDYIKASGFRFRKAKTVLTSPDPKFREKLDNIKKILRNLRQDEKFFSIDEYGPFAIKMKAGWSYTTETKVVPQLQKSKGWLICTAAIELSTNQLTHFYSLKKDTNEMIKLVDLLIQQYRNDKRLYISWDAASWHSSNKLKQHIKAINDIAISNLNMSPYVELAPLPSSAQFLNVIESVFSGLTKSIIQNSDYECVDDCKSAIDLYFTKRNEYFLKHPRRAGKMIWGKEITKAAFDDAHNCKDPKWCR